MVPLRPDPIIRELLNAANKCHTRVPLNWYLSDIVEVATLRARSCTEDIAEPLPQTDLFITSVIKVH
jgi:hypothetical protein